MDIRKTVIPVLILLGVLLIANVVFFFTTTRPQVDKYRQLVDDSGPQATMVQRQQKAVERLEGFVSKLEQAEQDMDTLRNEILSTAAERQTEVMAEIDDLCRQFNIPIEEVNLEWDVLEKEQVLRLQLIAPLEGNYTDLRRFLQAVEDSDKFVIVEQVALQAGGPQAKGLELDIALASYFQASEDTIQRFQKAGSSRRGRRGA